MSKHDNTENKVNGFPTAAALRKALAKVSKTDAMTRIRSLFDAKTFVELGAYTKRSFSEAKSSVKDGEFEGVICGYGAVNGQLVFAFAQDSERMKGALDAAHARKICSLYDLAIKNGAPVIGIFDCAGADIFEGVDALAGYGRIMGAVSSASGVIPQIALLGGDCIGSFAAIAAMYDFVISTEGGKLYVNSPALTGAENAQSHLFAFHAAEMLEATAYARKLLSFLPQNSSTGVMVAAATDDLNRTLDRLDPNGSIHDILSAIADRGDYIEVGAASAPAIVTALSNVGGVTCGLLASDYAQDEGRLTAAAARKAARFVDFCDAFSIPLVTLVNSAGYSVSADNECDNFAAELAKLSMAYTKSETAKVTVVLGRAIGGAYTLLGSKSVGADVAYAFEGAEIATMNAGSAVAFAMNDSITTTVTRAELEEEWRENLASPVAAASTGAIDDIISMSELRQRICSALLLLAAKGTALPRRHNVLPL